MAKQATQGRIAIKSASGKNDGFKVRRGTLWSGVAGPFARWMLTDNSSHLWRVDLPSSLPAGVHTMEIATTDRYGRTFRSTQTFEIVTEIPEMEWNPADWK